MNMLSVPDTYKIEIWTWLVLTPVQHSTVNGQRVSYLLNKNAATLSHLKMARGISKDCVSELSDSKSKRAFYESYY